MFWICLGYVLGIFWRVLCLRQYVFICCWYVFDKCWVCFGYVLACALSALSMCWFIVDMFWI